MNDLIAMFADDGLTAQDLRALAEASENAVAAIERHCIKDPGAREPLHDLHIDLKIAADSHRRAAMRIDSLFHRATPA